MCFIGNYNYRHEKNCWTFTTVSSDKHFVMTLTTVSNTTLLQKGTVLGLPITLKTWLEKQVVQTKL